MPDDLCNAIARALYLPREVQDGHWAARVVMAEIEKAAADPVRRLAILNLIGDVVGDVWLPDYFVSGATTDFQGFGIEPFAGKNHYVKALAVVPRGEATGTHR